MGGKDETTNLRHATCLSLSDHPSDPHAFINPPYPCPTRVTSVTGDRLLNFDSHPSPAALINAIFATTLIIGSQKKFSFPSPYLFLLFFSFYFYSVFFFPYIFKYVSFFLLNYKKNIFETFTYIFLYF